MKIIIEFQDQESHRLRVCFGVSLFCDIPFTVISGHPGTHLTEVHLKQLSLPTLTIQGQLPAGTEVGLHGIGVFAHLQQQLSLQSAIREELCLSIFHNLSFRDFITAPGGKSRFPYRTESSANPGKRKAATWTQIRHRTPNIASSPVSWALSDQPLSLIGKHCPSFTHLEKY